MAKTKITHTTEYPVDEFKKLIKDRLFDGKNVRITFNIQEVGGDYLDRFPGNQEVVSVRIEYDE